MLMKLTIGNCYETFLYLVEIAIDQAKTLIVAISSELKNSL